MNDIAIIIVTYNPNLKNLADLISELHNFRIYVSDNGSNNINEIKKLIYKYSNLSLIDNKDNYGIAVAQNKAMRKAYTDNAKYLFFLDQDSFITIKNLISLKKDYVSLVKRNKNFGILSAVPEDEPQNGSKIKYVNEVISSGMFVSTMLAKKVGYMLENLFIDMVDYEWCWRFKHSGLEIAKDYTCRFKHQIGNNKTIMGKIVISPFRLYYVFRNSIYLIKTNQTLNKRYHISLKYKLLKQFIFNALFCPQKISRLRYMVLGIKDANNKEMGKINHGE